MMGGWWGGLGGGCSGSEAFVPPLFFVAVRDSGLFNDGVLYHGDDLQCQVLLRGVLGRGPLPLLRARQEGKGIARERG